jgi:hypothetical protein
MSSVQGILPINRQHFARTDFIRARGLVSAKGRSSGLVHAAYLVGEHYVGVAGA